MSVYGFCNSPHGGGSYNPRASDACGPDNKGLLIYGLFCAWKIDMMALPVLNRNTVRIQYLVPSMAIEQYVGQNAVRHHDVLHLPLNPIVV